jgi:hypothetical protein
LTVRRNRILAVFPVAASLAALIVGCQEESSFAFTPSGLIFEKFTEPRVALEDPCEDVENCEERIHEMLEAVNAERARRRLPAVRLDDTLTEIAEFHACRMVESGFIGHEDPFDGSTVDVRAANFGYAFLKVGENLAAGQLTVPEVMRDWLESPSHRAIILDPAYTEIGIAVKTGGTFGTYWVQEFGRPLTMGVNSAQPLDGASSDEQDADPEPATKPADADTSPTSQKSEAITL